MVALKRYLGKTEKTKRALISTDQKLEKRKRLRALC